MLNWQVRSAFIAQMHRLAHRGHVNGGQHLEQSWGKRKVVRLKLDYDWSFVLAHLKGKKL